MLRKYLPLFVSLISFTIMCIAIIYSTDWNAVYPKIADMLNISSLGRSSDRFVSGLPQKETQTKVLGVQTTPTTYVKMPDQRESGSFRELDNVTLSAGKVYTVSIVSGPNPTRDGSPVSFTWTVNGPSVAIHTTSVYFGQISSPGDLPIDTPPTSTNYTQSIPDFMSGNYTLPMRFVGNSKPMNKGIYYFRAYAYIDGKHYWSDERMFTIDPKLPNSIRIVSFPSTLHKGEIGTFTWEILGPAIVTHYSAIVSATTSKPGALDTTVDLPQTPYSPLVKDFISGDYNVPIRLVGNVQINETGTFYFRAITFINGMNIWSDEEKLTVE